MGKQCNGNAPARNLHDSVAQEGGDQFGRCEASLDVLSLRAANLATLAGTHTIDTAASGQHEGKVHASCDLNNFFIGNGQVANGVLVFFVAISKLSKVVQPPCERLQLSLTALLSTSTNAKPPTSNMFEPSRLPRWQTQRTLHAFHDHASDLEK